MSDSRQEDFDWHKVGVWMVIGPKDSEVHGTVSVTPWGCRSEFLRMATRPWGQCEALGYYVQEYVRAAT